MNASRTVPYLFCDASTGPRSWERGDSHDRERAATACHGFNGAALMGARRLAPFSLTPMLPLLLQRGRAHGSAEIRQDIQRVTACPSCFNGAALMGARRLKIAVFTVNVERRSFNGAALMGARRCELLQCQVRLPLDRFNGAALMGARRSASRRSPPSSWSRRFNGAALMGARRCDQYARSRQSTLTLQRGRAHGSAEIARE